MELISDISSFNNPINNPISNTIDSISKNINKNIVSNNIKNNINTYEFIKQFELDKIIEENLKKYNDIHASVDLLEEVISELEKKSVQILDSINYIENINKESIKLFTYITR